MLIRLNVDIALLFLSFLFFFKQQMTLKCSWVAEACFHFGNKLMTAGEGNRIEKNLKMYSPI